VSDFTIKFKEKESGLLKIKPDARSFGFDCSKGAAVIGGPSHVYEMWVSIPDDMEISAPLVKRTFDGGLYAAHVLRAWDFQDWRRLKEGLTQAINTIMTGVPQDGNRTKHSLDKVLKKL